MKVIAMDWAYKKNIYPVEVDVSKKKIRHLSEVKFKDMDKISADIVCVEPGIRYADLLRANFRKVLFIDNKFVRFIARKKYNIKGRQKIDDKLSAKILGLISLYVLSNGLLKDGKAKISFNGNEFTCWLVDRFELEEREKILTFIREYKRLEKNRKRLYNSYIKGTKASIEKFGSVERFGRLNFFYSSVMDEFKKEEESLWRYIVKLIDLDPKYRPIRNRLLEIPGCGERSANILAVVINWDCGLSEIYKFCGLHEKPKECNHLAKEVVFDIVIKEAFEKYYEKQTGISIEKEKKKYKKKFWHEYRKDGCKKSISDCELGCKRCPLPARVGVVIRRRKARWFIREAKRKLADIL